MRKTTLWVVATVLFSGLVLGGFQLRQREQSAARLQRATRLMLAPIEEVGEVDQLSGSLAAQLVAEAETFHRSIETQATRHAARGVELLQQRDYLAAEGELTAGKKLMPDDVNLRVLLSAVWIASGGIEAATDELAYVLKLAPDHPRALMLTADLALANRLPAEALAIIERVLLSHPKAAVLFNRRGLIREALGDYAAARADYVTASEMDVHMAEAHVNRGRLLRDEGQYRQAEQAFSQALERNETASAAWMGRGLCRLQLGHMPEAELDLIRARDLAPGTVEPLMALSELYATAGDTDQAIELLRAAIAVDAARPLAWLKLGNSLMRVRELQDAAASYRKAMSLDGSLSAAHNGLGAALSLLGDHDGARIQLARAAELDQHDPNPLLNLARMNEKLGDRRGADLAWRAALDRDPNAPVPMSVRRSAGT